ncbi:hypothetical protein BS47DRAFT_21173 [Hydnum rufescens UP504]|uniref:Uncharacterized protein n=1 Tax=Hydnum rufescens UP504 TaxID=1448309 RepID=A0A9P6B8D8_9AGAM|nr:hypothetical protein BS47DRAFT_21173 [Hydnum rufescens UP504]
MARETSCEQKGTTLEKGVFELFHKCKYSKLHIAFVRIGRGWAQLSTAERTIRGLQKIEEQLARAYSIIWAVRLGIPPGSVSPSKSTGWLGARPQTRNHGTCTGFVASSPYCISLHLPPGGAPRETPPICRVFPLLPPTALRGVCSASWCCQPGRDLLDLAHTGDCGLGVPEVAIVLPQRAPAPVTIIRRLGEHKGSKRSQVA